MFILRVRSTGEELVSDVGAGESPRTELLPSLSAGCCSAAQMVPELSGTAGPQLVLRRPGGGPSPPQELGQLSLPQRRSSPAVITAAACPMPVSGQAFLWFLGSISYWHLFFICFDIFNVIILNFWPIHFDNSDSDYAIVCFRVLTSSSFCVNFKRQNSFSSKSCHISILLINNYYNKTNLYNCTLVKPEIIKNLNFNHNT